MANYRIQLPIENKIRKQVELKAQDIGLGNINDAIRFLLVNFAKGRVEINFAGEAKKRNYKKVLDKKSREIQKKLKKGTAKSYHSAKGLVRSLKS